MRLPGRMIASAVTVSLTLLLSSPSAFAEGLKETLGLNGSLRSAYWNNDKNYSDTRDYAVGSAWLTLRPKEFEGYRFYADGYIQGQNFWRSADASGDIREAYVEKSFGAFDFRVGRNIFVWGRGDKVNPTDNLTVKNYKLLMTDDEDQRSGVGSAQIVANLDRTRFILLWLPEWRSPVYPIPPTPGLSFSDEAPSSPAEQVAFKVDQTGGDVDWSLSAFHGFNRTPDLALASVSAQGTQLLFRYGKIDVFGADFATNLGSYGVRGEIAYTRTADNDGSDPLVQNSNIYAVLGADRMVMENFNINAQALYRYTFDWRDPNAIGNAAVRSLAKQVNINANQLDSSQAGFSLRPSYKMFHETLEAEVAVVTWFKQGDSILRPKLTYAISDDLKTSVGGEFYSGPADSFFGRLSRTSSVFAELRLIF